MLIIGFVWPEPTSSAAGTRMLQLIEVLKTHYEITFVSAATFGENSFDLESIGIKTVPILLNDDSFDDFIKKLNPYVVIFDRFMIEEQYGWRVSEFCPNVIRILDTTDLHFLRLARQNAFKENRAMAISDFYSETAKREIASILRCDISLIISSFEMQLLINQFNIIPEILLYLPFMVDEITQHQIYKWPKFDIRNDFVFVGNFLHEPNWNTVQNIKENVWPKLRKLLPEANIKIYGAYPSQKVLELHKPSEGFFIMGRAESAAKVVENARVVLAPIRFGAGAKGKLIEAMQCGTPSVTTSIGAEGMAEDLAWNGTVVDDNDGIINAAVEIYSNEKLWREFQLNGVEIVNQKFSAKLFSDVLLDKLNFIFKNLNVHRQHNFIGEILKHNTVSATKYMSKWIGEKNRER